jgi:hypothetical protein
MRSKIFGVTFSWDDKRDCVCRLKNPSYILTAVYHKVAKPWSECFLHNFKMRL